MSMLQWPRNRVEFWVFVRRLLALIIVGAVCAGCGWFAIRAQISELN